MPRCSASGCATRSVPGHTGSWSSSCPAATPTARGGSTSDGRRDTRRMVLKAPRTPSMVYRLDPCREARVVAGLGRAGCARPRGASPSTPARASMGRPCFVMDCVDGRSVPDAWPARTTAGLVPRCRRRHATRRLGLLPRRARRRARDRSDVVADAVRRSAARRDRGVGLLARRAPRSRGAVGTRPATSRCSTGRRQTSRRRPTRRPHSAWATPAS